MVSAAQTGHVRAMRLGAGPAVQAPRAQPSDAHWDAASALSMPNWAVRATAQARGCRRSANMACARKAALGMVTATRPGRRVPANQAGRARTVRLAIARSRAMVEDGALTRAPASATLLTPARRASTLRPCGRSLGSISRNGPLRTHRRSWCVTVPTTPHSFGKVCQAQNLAAAAVAEM